MENTIENKAKFFAQYWGQRVVVEVDGIVTASILFGRSSWYLSKSEMKNARIDLKPLSQITDEDAIEVQKLNPWADYREGQGNRQEYIDHARSFLNEGSLNILSMYADLLRSKGYALPYMGISVEQQIEWGWVKLKETN